MVSLGRKAGLESRVQKIRLVLPAPQGRKGNEVSLVRWVLLALGDLKDRSVFLVRKVTVAPLVG